MNINCTRSSAIAERSAQSAMSVEVLAYCCTNNANRSRVSSRSTFNNCHARFIPLPAQFCTRIIRLSLSEHAICCGCHQHTPGPPVLYLLMSTGPHMWSSDSTTTRVVDDSAYSSASASLWTRTTVADGHKFSAVTVRRLGGDFLSSRKTQCALGIKFRLPLPDY